MINGPTLVTWGCVLLYYSVLKLIETSKSRQMFPPTGTLRVCFCIYYLHLYEVCWNARWSLYWHFCHSHTGSFDTRNIQNQHQLINSPSPTLTFSSSTPEQHSSVMFHQLFLFLSIFFVVCSCIYVAVVFFSELHVYDQLAWSLHLPPYEQDRFQYGKCVKK